MLEKRSYQLDIVAQYFAAIMTAQWKPMFRFTALLTDAVDPALLRKALADTLPRFPYYTVILRTNFFWPYFQESSQEIELEDDGDRLFAPAQGGQPLFRICYHDRKISVEMQHLLGDGYGAMILLKTILVRYYTLQGVPVPSTPGTFNIHDQPEPEEYEDSYPRFTRMIKYHSASERPAYHVTGRQAASDQMVLTTGIMLTQDVLEQAHAHGASLTEYLSAILVQSIQELQAREQQGRLLPIIINIPADLRRLYATKTLRNFTHYINAGIDPAAGDCSLKETLIQLRRQCRTQFAEPSLNARMSENLKYFNLIRPAPLLVKKIVFKFLHWRKGERVFSMNLSNLGQVELPEAIRHKVIRFETMGSNFRTIKLECGVISFNQCLTVAFTSAFTHSRIQDRFFALLREAGIAVEIEIDGQDVRQHRENQAED